MLGEIFKKYINVDDYETHPLYKEAKDAAIEVAINKKVEYEKYKGYIIGFCEGYVKNRLKGLYISIRMDLHDGKINIDETAKIYGVSKEEVLYALKQVLNKEF